MRSAGFVPILDVRPCPRPLTLGLLIQIHIHQGSRRFTIPHAARPTAAPQTRLHLPFSLVRGS